MRESAPLLIFSCEFGVAIILCGLLKFVIT